MVLLGFGRVGRALVSATLQAEGRRDRPVRVVGLLDRSGYVFDPRGLSQRRLRLLAEGKDQGKLLAKLGGVAAVRGRARCATSRRTRCRARCWWT